MSDNPLILQSWRFTTVSAFAREVIALLTESTYNLELHVQSSELERLGVELESVRGLGRVTIREEKC